MSEIVLRRNTQWEPELAIIMMLKYSNGGFAVTEFTRSRGWHTTIPFDSHTEANDQYESITNKFERQ